MHLLLVGVYGPFRYRRLVIRADKPFWPSHPVADPSADMLTNSDSTDFCLVPYSSVVSAWALSWTLPLKVPTQQLPDSQGTYLVVSGSSMLSIRVT